MQKEKNLIDLLSLLKRSWKQRYISDNEIEALHLKIETLFQN